jgi:hypothetical protein
MQVSVATQEVEREGIARSKRMTMDGNDPVLWQFFSDTLYTNKQRWVLEYAQNARDADPNWKLVLPSAIKPYMEFIDNGTGMSREFMLNDFCVAGRSTKRDNNNQSGGFGIGRLSGPQGTLFECRNPDKIRTWSLVKDERNIPMVVLLKEEPRPADVLVGTTVRVPIEPSKTQQVIEETKRMLMFFDLPNFPKLEPTITGKTWKVFKATSHYGSTSKSKLENHVYVLVGGYTFSIDSNQVSSMQYKNKKKFGPLVVLTNAGVPIVLTVPIGSVDIALNRESLKYSDRTEDTLAEAATIAYNEIVEAFQAELDKQPTLWEATKMCGTAGSAVHAIVSRGMDGYYSASAGTQRKFTYKGKEISITSGRIPIDNTKLSLHGDTKVYTYDMSYQRRRSNTISKVKLEGQDTVHIPPANENLKIFLSDGTEDRVQARLLTVVDGNTYVVFVKAPNGDFTKILALMGHPPTDKISYLKDIQPPAIVRGKTSVRSKAKMHSFSIPDWKFVEETIQIDPDMIYVRLNLMKAQAPSGWFDHFRQITQYNTNSSDHNFVKDLIALLPNKKLIGVPASYKTKLDPTWVELSDFLLAQFKSDMEEYLLRKALTALFETTHMDILNLCTKFTDVKVPARWRTAVDLYAKYKHLKEGKVRDKQFAHLLADNSAIAAKVKAPPIPADLNKLPQLVADLEKEYSLIKLFTQHVRLDDLTRIDQKRLLVAIVSATNL